MKRCTIIRSAIRKGMALAVSLSLVGSGLQPATAQTMSGSSYLVAQPLSDRSVPFSLANPGVAKPIIWGLDTAWPSESNIRRGVAFMGADRVDLVRISFQPTHPLINGDLQKEQIDWLNYRLNLVDMTSPNTKLTINSDHPSVDSWYAGNAARWAQLMDVTTRRAQERGRTVVSIAPFNEPDYGWGQGTMQDFFNIAGELRANPRFKDIRISGGNTLNPDQALPWYNFLKSRLDEGNTHQLAGSFNSFANFYQQVRANGHHATGDELHNVMEAMVGVEYGMQTGIWWGTAELARGEFVKASDGVRLGYAEHRPNWTAASVYRGLDGKVQAFGGTSERQAVTTTYRFVAKDRDVYFEGYGPQREYTMVMPGGSGYSNGQTNAERVVNVTWGEDIQPAIISGQYLLVNRGTGQVMQVAGGSTDNGAAIQQATYNGATYQQWNVAPVSTRIGGDYSYFSITAAHSGKAIDDYNFTLDNGGRIAQWDNFTGVNQQRYLDYTEEGWFRIRSRHSAKCLEVAANGVDIVQQDPSSNPNQQWRLLPVGTPIEFTAPTAPTGLMATANAESVRLSWTASPDADVAGYSIFRAESANGPYNTIARGVRGTSYVDNTATLNGTYVYKIKAVDKALNRSGYSNQVSATTTGANEMVAQLGFNGNLLDNSPNLNHSASAGSVAYVAGKVGSGALAFNGTNTFLQLPATLPHQQEITVATWVYWNGGTAWQRIFDFGNDESQNMFLTPRSGNGTLRFAIKNGGGEQLIDAPALPTGVWSHVAVTLGENGARLYVNGQQVAQSTGVTIRPLDFKPVVNYIGRSQYPDALFNGRLDDFKVYNYALTPDEIRTLSYVPTVTVMHRDVDNYADNNAIQPLLHVINQGSMPLSLSALMLRYYVSEPGAALTNLSVNYAQLGNQNVRLRYVPMAQPQQGATGYVEVSFTEGAGTLAPGGTSGAIQAHFAKADYSALNELDDYSYATVRDQLLATLRITAYYDGALIAGQEPGAPTTPVRLVRALTESKNGPSATQINTFLEVRNEGNVPINYADLKVRYYFTADGAERLLADIDEGEVRAQLVKINSPLANADTYLELSFTQGGQLAPGSSTGRIRYRISKPDGGRFDQTNDYSYQEQPTDRSQNSHVVVYSGTERLWGQVPGASARLAASVEPGLEFNVRVIGNPLTDDQLRVDVTGVQGQPLRLSVSDLSGRLVSERRVEAAGIRESQRLDVSKSAQGILLLQVSTPTQSRTVKVLKAQ